MNWFGDKNMDIQHKKELDDFLLYMAKHANVRRFFPFPFHLIDKKTNDTEDTKDNMAVISDESADKLGAMLKDLDKHPDLIDFILKVDVNLTYYGKSVHDSIKEFEFRYSAMDERLAEIQHKQRWYMFHGSPLGNWHSIVRGGIKCLSGTSFMTTGAVYGNGIYMSDDMRVAQAYGAGPNGSCVAVVELYEDPAPYRKAPGIYVYNKDVVRPRYLFQLSKMMEESCKELLVHYKKMNEAEIRDSSVSRRITADLKPYDILSKDNNCFTIMYGGVIVRIAMDGYPHKCPVVIIPYKLDRDVADERGILTYATADWGPLSSVSDILKKIDGCAMTDVPNNNVPF